MRLIHEDRTTGMLRLRLDTPSDLWRIAQLIRPGDRVGASTTRRDSEAPADTPAAQRERRRVWLVVQAESVEFHDFSHHVRVTGPIVEGPFDQGRHHTVELEPGAELTVTKPTIAVADRAILDEGIEARGDPKVVVASVDWGESSILRLRGRAIEPVADVGRSIEGKRYKGGKGERDRAAYVEDLVMVLQPELDDATAVVIAGPGFLKETLAKRLAEASPPAKAKIRVISTSTSGRPGFDELLRSGKAHEALSGALAAEEVELVENLVRLLAGQRAAVGPAEVAEAVEAGAPETVLVSESLVPRPEISRILDGVRSARARLFVVRDEGPAGKRLRGLGGIGAILRYDWTPSQPRVRGSTGPPREAPRNAA